MVVSSSAQKEIERKQGSSILVIDRKQLGLRRINISRVPGSSQTALVFFVVISSPFFAPRAEMVSDRPLYKFEDDR